MLESIRAGETCVPQTSPYAITGPAVISFSGGRTSGYMLKHIVDAHGGTLPDDIEVVFANTGKERPETLDFVQECSARWGVLVVWVEYCWDEPHRTRIVSHNAASRNGEPFEALIDRKGFLPNPTLRYCTSFLKRDRIESYARHWLEWKSWSSVIGFRRDEPRRVHRKRVCGTPRTGARPQFPLYDAEVTKRDVLAWWKAQPFDLGLADHEGNCDACYLKARWKIEAIMRDRPDLAEWWIGQEAKAKAQYCPEKGHAESYTRFRNDREPYAGLLDQVQRQGRFDFSGCEVDWDGDDCDCTD
jgi:3'-phosphoadenosine 5'-phosphosulfate sulfotransferase (PAPS reductase)/FAD synthetase